MSVALSSMLLTRAIVPRAKAGKLLPIRWTRFGGKFQETAYNKAWRFGATEHRVSKFQKLGELIQQISADPHSAVVRGAIAYATNGNDILRRASDGRFGEAGRESALLGRT